MLSNDIMMMIFTQVSSVATDHDQCEEVPETSNRSSGHRFRCQVAALLEQRTDSEPERIQKTEIIFEHLIVLSARMRIVWF